MISSSKIAFLFLVISNCTFTESFHPLTTRSSVARLRCVEKSGPEWTPDSLDLVISKADHVSQGVVLLAQPSEYNHFLIKAAVFVYDFGTGRGSKGVILERATAFSMGETSPNSGPFGLNTLYLGGEDGSDRAIMFHKYDLGEKSKYIGAGIYTGGLTQAAVLVEESSASPKDFKFIFNSVEWGPGQLEAEVQAGRWDVANIPSNLILQQSSSAASLWSKARNTLR